MMLTDIPVHYAGGGFPWGLLIIGGLLYFLWNKGVIGGPGRRGNHGRYGGHEAEFAPPRMPMPASPAQGDDRGFRGPHDRFVERHWQAHESAGGQAQVVSPAHQEAASAASAPNTEPTR